MIDTLRKLFEKGDETGMQQREREAMVDLLMWTMYIDKVLTLPESDKIDRLAEDLTWTSSTPVGQYINASTSRVRDALGDKDKAAALLEDIHRRLDNEEMRREAYEACCDLAQADGQVADEEAQFLTLLKRELNVEDEG